MVFLFCYCCSGNDKLTTGECIYDIGSAFLESDNKMFQMGFFPRQKTSEVRQYVGIWYTVDPSTIVWVANRDDPVLDTSGFLTVSEDGSAKVLNDNETTYFSTSTGNM
ncbi:hypothetical protein L1887_14207 [Cichorium endivia]|nr:hypothetical protein L1887_14207 [Cichorium endivia]